MQLNQIKVKNENEFELDYRKEATVAKQIRTIAVLSLPTLQRLYKKYFEQSAKDCDDTELLIRKLQYWLQYKYYQAFNTPMSDALTKKCRAIMAMPLTPGGKYVMPKSAAKKAAEVEEVEEPEEEETESEEEAEEASEEGETESAAAETPKRQGVKRDGTPKTVVLVSRKGNTFKFTGKFLYEVLPGILAKNLVIKLSDHALAEAIRKAWAGTGMNYDDKRIRGERIMFNKGIIKGMTGVPANPLKEYDEKGNVVVREIPKQLQGHVKRGQPVAQTIKENKAKAAKKEKKG